MGYRQDFKPIATNKLNTDVYFAIIKMITKPDSRLLGEKVRAGFTLTSFKSKKFNECKCKY
jgi:hypothetical protein